MPEQPDLSRNHEILAYWINHTERKAYCIIRYLDVQQDEKHTNIFFLESRYDGY